MHKTGTTSIQELLSRADSALAGRGYHYPKAGRLDSLPGHHNLAWEISGDRRYVEDAGSIGEFMKEIAGRSDDIIISSEDFIVSLDSRPGFAGFVRLLQSAGLSVTVVIYLRSQLDYLPRAYLTLISAGWDLSWHESTITYAGLARQARNSDRVPNAYRILVNAGLDLTRTDSILDVDYRDVLRRLGDDVNVDVIVRSDDRAKTAICRDFLSIFGLTLHDLGIDHEIVENRSLYLREYLLNFLGNRMGRPLRANEEAIIDTLVSPEAAEIRLSPPVTTDLSRRYRSTNHFLSIRYGIPEPTLETTSAAHGSPEAPYVDELFSADIETQF
jgi:hypothetical protein